MIVRSSFAAFPAEAPERYEREIRAINETAKWEGTFAQVATVRPKFFGGHPGSIRAGEYVLCVSLNHKFDADESDCREYAALNASPETHVRACFEYFRNKGDAHDDFYYAPFFRRRAVLVRSFAATLGLAQPADDRELLERYSFYLERYPTWSPNSRPPRAPIRSVILDLNEQVWRILLESCPPRAILLAGADNAQSLSRLIEPRAWRVWNIRRSQYRCLIGIAELELAKRRVTAVRCNFLGTVYGPNSRAELEVLGRTLATGQPDPSWE